MTNPDVLLAQARDALPLYVTWGPVVLVLVLAWVGPRAIARAFGSWFGRRLARDDETGAPLHWTERARRLAVAALYAGASWWPLFLGSTLLVAILNGPLRPIPATRLVPLCWLIGMPRWSHGFLRGWRAGSGLPPVDARTRRYDRNWSGFIGDSARPTLLLMLLFMPLHFGVHAWLVFFAGCAALLIAISGGKLRWSRLVGAVYSATPPLQSAVRRLAEELGMPTPRTWIHRTSQANAAVFAGDSLVVTEPMLHGLAASEVRAVLAHEFAHLGESRRTRVVRRAFALAPCALALAYPILGEFGPVLAVLYGGVVILVIRRESAWTHGHEVHADWIARGSDDDPQAFGRAIERLAEINGTPVVTSFEHKTHPDCYDRMRAAGYTPRYPRPEPPYAAHANWVSTVTTLLVLTLLGGLVSWKRSLARNAWSDAQVAQLGVLVSGGAAWPTAELGIARFYGHDVPEDEDPVATAERREGGLALLAYAAHFGSSTSFTLDHVEALVEFRRFDEAAAVAHELLRDGSQDDWDFFFAVQLARLGEVDEVRRLVEPFEPLSFDHDATTLAETAVVLAVVGQDERAVQFRDAARAQALIERTDADDVDWCAWTIDALTTDLDGEDLPIAPRVHAVLADD